MRSAAGTADAGDQGPGGERARLANNLACLYAAMLRPKEAIAVLEACQDRAGSPGGAAAPEVLDMNLGLCYLQLADLTARHAGYVPMDSAAKASIAGIEVRPENARAINEALQSAEETAQRARLAMVDRHRDKAVTIFEALGRRHDADAESPQACLIRDCLAFSLLGAYDDYSVWPAWAVSRARPLFEENSVWHDMTSGDAADATLRSRIRAAVVAGMTSGGARAGAEAMTELRQVLDIAEETSASVAAQCLLALSHLAMDYEPDEAAGYAASFAGHCLAALGPEHPWSCFAAGYLELIRVQVPVSWPKPAAPYAQSLTVWEGPYAASPAGHLEYPVVVPYLLAGDIPGAASRCYEIAAARTAQRDGPADFHAELRATIEWRCDRELSDIRKSAPGTDFSWLRPWLSQALSRDDAILELASPNVTAQ
jgi:hypothetical protein